MFFTSCFNLLVGSEMKKKRIPGMDEKKRLLVKFRILLFHIAENRRRAVSTALAAALFIAVFAAVADADEVVRVGLYQNKPKIFTDQRGKADGIFINLLDEMARKEKWKLVYVPCEWTECLKALGEGRIDLMPDVAYSWDRAEKFDFHKIPVVESWSQVYSRPGKPISSMSDLSGRRIALLKDSIQQKALQQTMSGFGYNVTIIPVSSFDEAFRRVADNSADAAIANRFFGDYFYQEYKLAKTPVVFNIVPLFYATGRGRNHALLEKIDSYLGDWISKPNSPYYKTLYRWEEKPPVREIPRYFLWIIGVVCGLLGLSAGLIALLRLQVRARTKHLKEANEELEKHRDRLEELVAARTAELAVAKEKAEEADRLKSVFLASMSHELRTPLNSIIGFTGIILMGLAGELNEEQKNQLTMVKNSANHLLSLINDILDISKIEAGKVDLSISEFELGDVVKEVVEIISPAANEKDLKVIVEQPPGKAMLLSDRRRVKQILVNLAGNAVKFTERGHVKISAFTEGGELEIRVSDTGPGIKEENMRLLFNPFQQVNSEVARKHEGTGLGLHLCRKLVELLGGDIRAESEYGNGSTFAFKIPLKHEEAVACEKGACDRG